MLKASYSTQESCFTISFVPQSSKVADVPSRHFCYQLKWSCDCFSNCPFVLGFQHQSRFACSLARAFVAYKLCKIRTRVSRRESSHNTIPHIILSPPKNPQKTACLRFPVLQILFLLFTIAQIANRVVTRATEVTGLFLRSELTNIYGGKLGSEAPFSILCL